MTKKTTFHLFLWIAFFEGIGFMLGLLTQNNIDPWYDNLIKSSLTPPSVVFSIVWPILYAFLAIAGYNLWQHQTIPGMRAALLCYIAQLIMNWAWTPLFFHFHWIGFSFLWILTLTFLTAFLIYLIKDKLKKTSVLLIPYFLWLVFAAYLNWGIWMLN